MLMRGAFPDTEGVSGMSARPVACLLRLTGGLAMPDKIDLEKDSAHVRLKLLGPAPLAPHFQLRISGMSSPYCRM